MKKKRSPRKLEDKNISQLKKKADEWFSRYIRIRDADDNGYVRCITCDAIEIWKYVDAGHFVPRQHLGTRYNKKNVNGQCKKCNNKDWHQGEQYRHGKAIDVKYGEGTADLLNEVPRDNQKISRSEYMQIIQGYRTQARAIAEKKGLEI